MDPLVAAALAARENAHAPFSHFKVGAALEDTAGRIHTGCNVENASYGLTLCADASPYSRASPKARAASAAWPSSPTPRTSRLPAALPPDPLGILRRRRTRALQPSRQNGNLPPERSLPKALRCVFFVASCFSFPRWPPNPPTGSVTGRYVVTMDPATPRHRERRHRHPRRAHPGRRTEIRNRSRAIRPASAWTVPMPSSRPA